MNKVPLASATHFPGRRKIEKGGGGNVRRGEGKPKILLQMLPTSTRLAPGRVLPPRQREGSSRSGSPGSARSTPSLRSELFLPRALQGVLLPADCGEDASSSSRLLPGPGRRRSRDEAGCGRLSRRAPGAAATWPREPAPCRRPLAGRAVPPGSAPGLPLAPRGRRRPSVRGCADEFRGRGRQPRSGQRLGSLLHSPGLRASFLTDAGGWGAGGGGAAAAEET